MLLSERMCGVLCPASSPSSSSSSSSSSYLNPGAHLRIPSVGVSQVVRFAPLPWDALDVQSDHLPTMLCPVLSRTPPINNLGNGFLPAQFSSSLIFTRDCSQKRTLPHFFNTSRNPFGPGRVCLLHCQDIPQTGCSPDMLLYVRKPISGLCPRSATNRFSMNGFSLCYTAYVDAVPYLCFWRLGPLRFLDVYSENLNKNHLSTVTSLCARLLRFSLPHVVLGPSDCMPCGGPLSHGVRN